MECFTNGPPAEAVDIVIDQIKNTSMVGFYRAWMSDVSPFVVLALVLLMRVCSASLILLIDWML